MEIFLKLKYEPVKIIYILLFCEFITQTVGIKFDKRRRKNSFGCFSILSEDKTGYNNFVFNLLKLFIYLKDIYIKYCCF